VAGLAAADAMALSPGVVDQDVERLPRLRQGPPTFPFQRDFHWSPEARVSARGRSR
jgi:hypothetical protein